MWEVASEEGAAAGQSGERFPEDVAGHLASRSTGLSWHPSRPGHFREKAGPWRGAQLVFLSIVIEELESLLLSAPFL